MTRIILIRHCEAEGNIKRVFQGHTDADISENGRKQLDLLRLRCRNMQIDAIYSSPLKRAYQTDSTLNQQLSDGLAGLLQGCNTAVTQCLPEKLPVHGELSPSQLQHGNFSVYIRYA